MTSGQTVLLLMAGNAQIFQWTGSSDCQVMSLFVATFL